MTVLIEDHGLPLISIGEPRRHRMTPKTQNGLGLLGALRKPRTMPDLEVDWSKWIAEIESEARRDAAGRVEAWAGCVKRLMAVAPTGPVMEEVGMDSRRTGVTVPHSTPPERKAIREAALKVVDGWLARDLEVLGGGTE